MLQLAVRAYRRPFRTPLQTHHGVWTHREGLLLRVTDEQGQTGFGEIAPLPWFGTETQAQAQDFCRYWPRPFSLKQIQSIPTALPACQFGLTSAVRPWQSGPPTTASSRRSPTGLPSLNLLSPKQRCGLLPTGRAALDAWQSLWNLGHRVFKWKIGVAGLQTELPIFQALMAALPLTARIRLDANGGLTPEAARLWLTTCDDRHEQVEFLEQPLSPPLAVDWITAHAHTFQTAIALDESVSTLSQLQAVHAQMQDRVIYVLKPAIAGFPDQLKAFCLQHQLDVVCSSALETAVGKNAALQLAQELWQGGLSRRALGFGVDHWFADNWSHITAETLWAMV